MHSPTLPWLGMESAHVTQVSKVCVRIVGAAARQLEQATAARAEFTRTLGLRNLDPGLYLVRLTLTGAGATATSQSDLAIVR